MIELPTKKTGITRSNPRFLIIFGKPKSGKTTALSMLDNNLIIDLEKGASFVDALKVEPETTKDLLELATSIKEAGKPYKYITLDTATALEDDYVMRLAIKMYQSTPMGANYRGDDLRKLPNGAGYLYIRDAFKYIIDLFIPLCDTLILTAHCVEKQIDKEGKEMFELEMDLSGKLKRVIAAKSDALGFLYRKDNRTFLNFNGGGDVIIEARSPHLANNEFLIVEKTENGFVSHWDKIFLKE